MDSTRCRAQVETETAQSLVDHACVMAVNNG